MRTCVPCPDQLEPSFFRVWLEAASFCFEFVLRVMFVFFSVKTEPNEFFFNLNNIYAIKLLDIVPGNLVVVELFGSEARVRDKFIEIRKTSIEHQFLVAKECDVTLSSPIARIRQEH